MLEEMLGLLHFSSASPRGQRQRQQQRQGGNSSGGYGYFSLLRVRDKPQDWN